MCLMPAEVPPPRAFIVPSDMAEAPGPPASRRYAGHALSLVSDIGRGWPADEAMRACLVTSALARIVSVSPGEASARGVVSAHEHSRRLSIRRWIGTVLFEPHQ